MSISSSIMTNEDMPPSIVETNRGKQNISVVDRMVVSDPGSSETPEGLYSRVLTESRGLLLLSL